MIQYIIQTDKNLFPREKNSLTSIKLKMVSCQDWSTKMERDFIKKLNLSKDKRCFEIIEKNGNMILY